MRRASCASERPSRVRRSTRSDPSSKMSASRPLAINRPGSTRCALDDPRRLMAPVTIPEQSLVELASRLPRELRVEVDRLRALVVGELLAAEPEQLLLELGAGVVPLVWLHDRVDLLAHVGIRDAEHRDVEHLRMRDEHV